MKKLFKKAISLSIAGVLCIGVLFSASACGKDSGGGSGLKMVYTTTTLDDFREVLQQGVIDAASAEGVTLDVKEECSSVDQQVDQIKQAAEAGYDAVICLPVDPATALQLEIAAGDMPIIFVNSMPSSEYLKPDKYMYVGSYERDAGEFQAEYVWEKLGKPSSFNAIIFMGQQGHAATIGRTGAVKEFYRENGVDVNYVFCDYATWSDEIAAERFEIFLKTGQEFDAVFCNNDTMALGIVEAMEKNGFSTSDIPVCGVDATVDGCQSIVDGGMSFTVKQSGEGQGEMSIKAAEAIVKKGTTKDVEGVTEDRTIVWVPFEPVDASNVKEYQ